MRNRLIKILCTAFVIYEIVIIVNIPSYFNRPLPEMVARSGFMFFALSLAYLTFFFKGRSKLSRVIDVILLLMAVIPCLYVFIEYKRSLWHIINDVGRNTWFTFSMGIVLFISILEAARRGVGKIYVGICIVFMLHSYFGHLLPGVLHSMKFSLSQIVYTQFLTPHGIWGIVLNTFTYMIFPFILFGSFLKATGAIEGIMKLALFASGQLRGGPAKVAVVASGFLGMISGSAIANVATTGAITIPLMKRMGYKPYYAGAVEAAASTGGMIMPPVMASGAFLMASWLGITYWEVCIAAFIPGALYFLAIFIQSDFQAARLGMKGLPRTELPSFKEAIMASWGVLIPLVVLVYLLGAVRMNPAKAVLISMVVMIAVTAIRRETRLNWRKTIDAIHDTGRAFALLGIIAGIVGLVLGSFTITGFGLNIAGTLVTISGGNLGILAILTAVACLIMGMGMSGLVIYIFMASLVAPALIRMGMMPLASHLFVMYFSMISGITPPVCVTSYAAAAIAGASPFKLGFQAVRLGFVSYLVPFSFLFYPALIMQGSPLEIIPRVGMVLVGVVFVSMASEGFIVRSVGVIERLLLGLGGLMLLIPLTVKVAAFDLDLVVNLAGLIIGGIGIFIALGLRRLIRKPALATADDEDIRCSPP
ncbi:TRAP transporter permease [Chloroflexota bacterium]